MYPRDKSNDNKVKGVVADIVENMLYNGDDGYFFIYDVHGNNVVHPKQPNRVGKSWWDLRDEQWRNDHSSIDQKCSKRWRLLSI